MAEIATRVFLFFYFIIILSVTLYFIVYFWTPSTESINIKSITKTTGNATHITVPLAVPISGPNDTTKVNATNVTLPISGSANITTKTTTTDNSTTRETKTESFLELENGTTRILSEDQKFVPKKGGPIEFLQLQATNPEIRLISVTVLFGLLGACVSGLISVFTRRLWDGKNLGSLKLIYRYIARPWLGPSVSLVTYVTIRAGLINVGEATVISEFGIAAISALVGLMSDEMISRLRDVFRSLFGINDFKSEQDLQLSFDRNNIHINEEILISATISELRPNQAFDVYFLVEDTSVVEFIAKDSRFNPSGIATARIKAISNGATFVTAMTGDLDLYASSKVVVV
jgi:hypothetical protein